MKSILTLIFLISGLSCFAQSSAERDVLALSARIFNWEVAGHIDSLEKTLDEKFIAVNSAGETQTKAQYLQRLSGGNFVHNAIVVQKHSAIISGNTAVVTGNGSFTVTVGGQQATRLLSYIEVFIRANSHKPWKLLAMKAGSIPQQQ